MTLILLSFVIAGLVAITGREGILHNKTAVSVFYWTIFFASLAYHVLMESGSGGATLGKRWMNLKIVDADGKQLSVPRALGRLLARLFSFLPFFAGFLFQPFNRRKQALHDMIAGTVVVQASENKKISVMASLLVLFFALLVPVVALFSTAGLPLYQQYVLKVQMDHGMKTGEKATKAIAAYYLANGRVPAVITDADVTFKPAYHIAGIDINQQNGELSLTFSDAVGKAIVNKHLLFTPAMAAGQSIVWQCHSTDIEARLLPASCK